MWIAENPSAWRLERRKPTRVTGQKVVIYYGEAGVGKTTQLGQDAEQYRDDGQSRVIWLDFTTAGELDAASIRSFSRPLSNFIQDAIGSHFTPDREQFNKYTAARVRYIVAKRSGYILTKVKREYADCIADMTDEQVVNSTGIMSTIDRYEAQALPDARCVDSLHAAQDTGQRRAIFMVDNVDHLDPEKIQGIFKFLSTGILKTTLCYVAIRTENLPLTARLRHQRPVEEVCLQNDTQVLSVLPTRISGACKYIEGHEETLLAEAETRHQRVVDLHERLESDQFSSNPDRPVVV